MCRGFFSRRISGWLDAHSALLYIFNNKFPKEELHTSLPYINTPSKNWEWVLFLSRRILACKLALAGLLLPEAEYGCIRVQPCLALPNAESRPGSRSPAHRTGNAGDIWRHCLIDTGRQLALTSSGDRMHWEQPLIEINGNLEIISFSNYMLLMCFTFVF